MAPRSIGVLLIAAVVASGCSSLRDQASADPPPTQDATDVLRVGFVGDLAIDPATLNPSRPGDVLAADLLFDGLTRVDPSGTVLPELAESWSTSDGTTWRFELRSRRTSDGDPITAEVIVSSLRRVIALRSTSLAAARLDVIADLRADGPSTVVISTANPYYELPAVLADPSFGVVTSDETLAIAEELSTTGPYRVGSTGGGSTRLVPTDAAGTNVDAIEFRTFDAPDGALASFERGQLDLAPLGDSLKVPANATDTYLSAATVVLELDTRVGPWADATARVALSRAIDRVAAVAAATRDDARIATSLLPGAEGGCDDGCGPDAASVAALGPVGAAAGPLELLVPPGASFTSAATALAAQLADAGLQVTPKPVDAATLGAAVGDGSMRMSLFGVVGTTPSADPYLAAIFGRTGTENLTGYTSDEFEAALGAARSTVDPAARRAAYEALEAQVLAAAPVVPLMRVGERFAVSERVDGAVSQGGLLFDGRTVSLRRPGRGN